MVTVTEKARALLVASLCIPGIPSPSSLILMSLFKHARPRHISPAPIGKEPLSHSTNHPAHANPKAQQSSHQNPRTSSALPRKPDNVPDPTPRDPSRYSRYSDGPQSSSPGDASSSAEELVVTSTRCQNKPWLAGGTGLSRSLPSCSTGHCELKVIAWRWG